MRVCKKCGGRRPNGPARCKTCFAKYMEEWRKRNPEKCREQEQKKKVNGVKARSNRNYYLRHTEKVREVQKRCMEKNREHYQAYKRAWYQANKERVRKICKEAAARRMAADPVGERKKRADAARRRRASDPQQLIYDRIGCLMRQHLKRKSRKPESKAGRQWPKLVGYTLERLIARLKSTIPVGHTWDDYLAGVLEVDHITPDCEFEYTTVDDPGFRKSWALKNLRLLTARENNSRRFSS